MANFNVHSLILFLIFVEFLDRVSHAINELSQDEGREK